MRTSLVSDRLTWRRVLTSTLSMAAIVAAAVFFMPADSSDGMRQGKVALESAGALEFGPDGVLFVADNDGATVYLTHNVGIYLVVCLFGRFRVLAKIQELGPVQSDAVCPGTDVHAVTGEAGDHQAAGDAAVGIQFVCPQPI